MHTASSISNDLLSPPPLSRGGVEMPHPHGSFASRLHHESAASTIQRDAQEAETVSAARLQRARDTAAQFVGMAFIQPLLAQMRESPFAAGPFAPTTAEERFGPVYDALLSDRIARATRFPLTELIAQRLLGERQEVNIHA